MKNPPADRNTCGSHICDLAIKYNVNSRDMTRKKIRG